MQICTKQTLACNELCHACMENFNVSQCLKIIKAHITRLLLQVCCKHAMQLLRKQFVRVSTHQPVSERRPAACMLYSVRNIRDQERRVIAAAPAFVFFSFQFCGLRWHVGLTANCDTISIISANHHEP